ncbi:MAG: hypothetical protein AAGD38_18410, partial [Acidobacteriota bacterium]
HFEIGEIPVADEDPSGPVDPQDSSTYRHDMRRPEGQVKPLVVITSNVERQLPDPFLRRCVFFHITFPSTDALHTILRSRFDVGELFLDRVIDVFEALRGVHALTKKPATSELLNWTQVLTSVYSASDAKRVLDRFAGLSARAQRWSELAWGDLPAMGCLIKLREDRDRLLGEL